MSSDVAIFRKQVREALISLDAVSDALFDGQRFRALTIVDNYTRESLAGLAQSHQGG